VPWHRRRAFCLKADVAHLSRFAPALVVMVLAACGGKSFEVDHDPDPQGGSAPGGSGQGGFGNVGNVAGTSLGGSISKGGTGSAGTAQGGYAGGTCDGFNDDPGYFVSVAIINKTMNPIYLGEDTVSCSVAPLFAVETAGGSPLTGPGSCSSSCQMLRDGDEVGCPAVCAFPSTLKLEPGEAYYTQWDGLYQLRRELPAECRSGGRGATACDQTLQIDPGSYRFSSVAGTSPDCSQTNGGACGTCNPTGNGGCTVPGSLISGARHHATTTVYLDASYGVWGNPAPAPAPAFPKPSGDVPGGAIALLTVELVFAD